MYKRKLVLLVLVMFVLASCASMETKDWRQTIYLSYATTGNILESCRVTAKQAQAQGYLTAEQIEKIKVNYEFARSIYRTAGDLLILASDTEDAAKRDELVAKFKTLMVQVENVTTGIEAIVKGGK